MPLETPTVTGYSEFWGGANAYAPARARSSVERRGIQLIARVRGVRALLDAYVNSGATPAVSDSYKRVKAVQDTAGADLGGVRTIETVTVVSTTADADNATDMDNLLDRYFDPPLTYPVDLSGNGGGGKAGV